MDELVNLIKGKGQEIALFLFRFVFMKPIYILITLLFFLTGCNSDKPVTPVMDTADYNDYLNTSMQQTHTDALSEKEFWSKRLRPDSSGVGDLGPLAGSYTRLFQTTGNAAYLQDAEKLYKKAMAISANNKDVYARALAHTYISQHRFKEAKQVLEETYAGVSNKRPTEHALFDVYMELGEYEKAEGMLDKLKNMSDFNYLIRLAKWNDHKGDLDTAIALMEKARDIADSRKSKSLQIWTYSNLADYYGHAGRIEDSYNYYIKTLQLQPDNAYVKKGLAWIAYSYEKDTAEANRILDSVMSTHTVPDYYLLKAELAEFEGNTEASEKYTNDFLESVREGQYGGMYNTYLIEIYAETNPKRGLEIAKDEVGNRATSETYQLLAYAELKNGNKERALQLIEDKVAGKTFEPMALYYSALVYDANDLDKKAAPLLEELSEASYEIGPVLSKKVRDL
jgi:Tfp pilus assembly protein PilF